MTTAALAGIDRREPSHAAAIVTLSLAMLLSSLGTSIANVALPTLAQAFAASFREVQWVVIAYLLGATMLVVTVGRLTDLWGRRRLLVAATLLFALASLAGGVAPSLPLLIAARAAQGLGAGAMMTVALAMVGDAVPPGRTGKAMGVMAAMSAVGTALGPTIGGGLIGAFGWRAIFLVNVPLALIAAAMALRHLPVDSARATPRRFDIRGSLLLAATLGSFALALTLGREAFGPANLALLAASICGLALFARVEARSPSPLVPLAALGKDRIAVNLAQSLTVSAIVMATLVVGPFYLARALGLSPGAVGLAMSVGPCVVALSSVPAGRLVDALGARTVSAAGLAAITAGCALLALLPSARLLGYLVPVAVLTGGYAFFQTANNAAVMTTAAREEKGLVSGLLNLSRSIGLIAGTALLGAVFALAAGKDVAHAPAEVVGAAMRATFAVAALLAAMALLMQARPAASSCPSGGNGSGR